MADTSLTPRAGFWYIAQKGDFLRRLSQIAYGDEMQWSKIWAANTFQSGNPDVIYPGEKIFIPGKVPDPVQIPAQQNKFADRAKNTYAFLVGGREIPVLSFRLQRSFDSIFDSWAQEIAWRPGDDAALDKLVRRDSFSPSQLYIGPQLMATGRLYNVKNKLSTSGSTKVLECFTNTVDLVDSKMPPNLSYEWSGTTLRGIASDLLHRLGYSYLFDASLGPNGTGPAFDWVNIEKIESYSAFLIRLAGQRGVLIDNDELGRVVFQKANLKQDSVGTLSDLDIQGAISAASATGAPTSQEWTASFSGRERFHLYSVIGQGGDASDILSTVTDQNVPMGRTMTYEGEDVDESSVLNTANWRRSKQLAKAWTLPIPVTSWYNPKGDLWSPGQLVTVKSAYLEIPNGANFLIRKTEHVLDSRGMTCELTVVPPQTFTGQDLPAEFL